MLKVHEWLLPVALGCAVVLPAVEAELRIWDPPAIRVHPDHDRAANSPERLSELLADGKSLFSARFNAKDGAGRPAATGDSKPTSRIPPKGLQRIRTSGPDANSCAGCHNQPAIGGSGDFAVNAFVGAHFEDTPSSSIRIEVTSERNTVSIFGAGAIEMVAREMTRDLRSQRAAALAKAAKGPIDVHLNSKGVSFGTIIVRRDGTYDQAGLKGVDDDLVVKPFGVKGVAISIREFTIGALNQHHGIQAVERFGWDRTGRRDFDEDGVEAEFTIGQLSALVMFQASLPPRSRARDGKPDERARRDRGEKLFSACGCAACHVPFLTLDADEFTEPNPYNRPGAITPDDVKGTIRMPLPRGGEGSGIRRTTDGALRVWAYSDLKRHRICDDDTPHYCNEKLRQDNVPVDQFLTAKLWDLAASAPYGHRGDCNTVSEAILQHGGDAARSRAQFDRLDDEGKRDLVTFLLSLGASDYVPVHRHKETKQSASR